MQLRKAPDFAVLFFTLFGLLWLTLGLAAFAGLPLLPGAAPLTLFQGVLYLVAALAAAARLSVAPAIASGCAAAILLLPLAGLPLSGPQPRRPGAAIASASVIQQRLLEQLTLPVALREKWALLDSQWLHTLGYEEAPAVQSELQERTEKLVAWMRAHPSQLQGLRSTLAPQVPARWTQQQFEEALRKALRGENYPWLADFLAMAKASGAPTEAIPPGPADKERSQQHALDWLRAHPDFIESLRRSGPAYTGDPIPQSASAAEPEPVPEDPARSFRAAGLISGHFWMVMLPLGAVWLSRGSFRRPWDAQQFPTWAWEGLRRLVRAPALVVAGLAVFGVALSGLVLYWKMPTALIRRLIAALLTAGGSLFASGLTLAEEDDVH